ncbi:MAG: ATP-grasp domain-containing protein [Candidatus Dojkabacteria bacterium]|nr:ATP-grasp domain-containing protein [Candidatus Dojkabacteria bacterium]
MDKNTLLKNINTELKSKPLIFFTREAERVLGLEDELENYHICCIQDDYYYRSLKSKGISIFSLEAESGSLDISSTSKLLSHNLVIEWIKSTTNDNGFYGQIFFPSSVSKFKIEKLGGTYINNDPEICKNIENKFWFDDFLKEKRINKIPSLITRIDEVEYTDLDDSFGSEFVIQEDRGHTGSGTHLIKNEDQYNLLREKLGGNQVKFSKVINGDTFTLNVVVGKNENFIGPIQYQITGIRELTPGLYSTVGNDFISGPELPTQIKHSILMVSDKLANELNKIGYQGLFGIDLILDSNSIYIIEVNARQTANIPFQTYLENDQIEQPTQNMLNLALALGINIDEYASNYKHVPNIKGAQVFLRSFEDNYVVKNNNKSGIYNYNASKSSYNWVREGYSIKDIESNS